VIPRSSRLALCCLALLLSFALYFKGRATTVKGEGAALLRAGSGVVVRLAGDFPRPGVYGFAKGVTPRSAINMTLPACSISAASSATLAAPLASGDIVTLKMRAAQAAEVSIFKMGAKERMLLGIPLDPDLMGAEEWCALPGIGAALSARIVADRQKYGAFGSLQGLLRVSGIGHGKLEAIRRYF
jgi:competence protein ComEA